MHLRYIQLQSYIDAKCFGVIYAILRDFYTKIYYLLTYLRHGAEFFLRS